MQGNSGVVAGELGDSGDRRVPVSHGATMWHQMQPNHMPHRGNRCNTGDHSPGQTACSSLTHATDNSDRIPNPLMTSRSHKGSNDASDAIPRTLSQATWVCLRSCGVNRLAKPPALAALRAGSHLWSEKSPAWIGRPPVQRREELEVERAAVVNTKSSGDLPFIARRRIVTTDSAMVMVRRGVGSVRRRGGHDRDMGDR